MPPKGVRFWSARRVTLVMLAALILAVAGHLRLTYNKSVQDAEALVSALANAIDQHVGGSVRNIGLLLEDVAAAVQDDRHRTAHYAGDLRARLASFPEVRHVTIVSRDGTLVGPTWPSDARPEWGAAGPGGAFLAGAGQGLSHRPLTVGDPVIGRATGERTIHVSRAFTDAQGEFAGVAVAAVNPDVYAEFLSSVLYSADYACGVIGAEGLMLARAPQHTGTFGLSIADSELFRTWLPRAPRGVGRMLAKSDGDQKLLAYRTLPDSALVVVASLSWNRVVGSWEKMAMAEVAIALAFASVLISLIRLVERRVAAMEAEQDNLEHDVADKTRELQEAHELIHQRAQQLAWRNFEWQRLATVAAHHLQEPLRAVVSFSQLMGNRSPSAERQEIIKCILQDGVAFKEIMSSFQNHVVAILDTMEDDSEFSSADDSERPSYAFNIPRADDDGFRNNIRARGVAVIICVGLVVGTFYQLSIDRSTASRSAERLTNTVVNAVEQHLRSRFRGVETVLREAVSAVEEQRLGTEAFQDWMDARLVGHPEIRTIAFADPNGIVTPEAWRGTSAILPEGQVQSKRYYLQQQSSFSLNRLVVGDPERSQDGNQRSFALSLPVSTTEGRFGGIVFAWINADAFVPFLNSQLLDEDGASAIVTLEGLFLAREPQHEIKFGLDISRSDLFTKGVPSAIKGSLRGALRFITIADGLDKFIAFRIMPDYGLVLTSGITYQKALRDWFPLAVGEVVIVVLACALIMLWAYRVDIQGRILQRSRVALAREVAERTADVAATHALASARTARLERISGELHRLASWISDELQIPLQSVTSRVMQLHESFGDGDRGKEELMSFVRSGAIRLHAILRDFKRYVTVSARPPKLVSFDCRAVAQAVADDILTVTGTQSARFILGRMPRVVADEEMVREVFRELFGNAIKHRARPDPVEIRVEARREDGRWVISVADDGPGIPAYAVDGLFRAFENAPDRDADSTGLGLPLCFAILQTHDQRIWLEPSARGAVFCFSLPAAETVVSRNGDGGGRWSPTLGFWVC